MTIGSDSVLVRNDSLPHTDLEDSLVFLSVESGDYLRLHGIAREIWDRLESPTKLSGLIDDLATQHGADRVVVGRDLLPFLDDMLKAGLVTASESAP